jgi:hypothetical protein
MSAFICSPKHIATVAVAGFKVANDYDLHVYCGPDSEYLRAPKPLAKLLMAENIRSVAYRYPKNVECSRPGQSGFDDEALIEEAGRLTDVVDTPSSIVETLKLLNCVEYQSCETPGYDKTPAAYAIRSLREHLVAFLPGYAEAPWSI